MKKKFRIIKQDNQLFKLQHKVWFQWKDVSIDDGNIRDASYKVVRQKAMYYILNHAVEFRKGH